MQQKKVNLSQHVQVLGALLCVYASIIYITYSIAKPNSMYAITQMKVYDTIKISIAAIFSNNDTLMNAVGKLMPISEIMAAYDLLTEFINPSILNVYLFILMVCSPYQCIGLSCFYLSLNYMDLALAGTVPMF